MKIIITLLLLLSQSQFLFSQEKRVANADKLYRISSYSAASEMYEDVLERGMDSVKVGHQLADCYYHQGRYKKAFSWYQYLNEKSKLSENEMLSMALIQRRNEQYDASLETMKTIESIYGQNDVTIAYLNFEKNGKTIDSSHEYVLRLEDINTEASEMGASYMTGDKVLLSSSKARSAFSLHNDKWTGNYYYDLYTSRVDEEGNLKKLKPLRRKARTKFHDAVGTIDSVSGYVYFTRNDYSIKRKKGAATKRINLGVYKGRLKNNTLVDIELLPFNNDSYSCAHPTLSADGNYLYFSSNMPGGYGGMDIYCVHLDSLDAPRNMGDAINTSLDEVFPHYNAEQELLYFASEGHSGQGGLDILVGLLKDETIVMDVLNLGESVNSSADDFSFITSADQSRGYLTSDRNAGKGSDDIYSYNLKNPIINKRLFKGQIKDVLSKEIIANATIYLVDQKGNILDSLSSDEEGRYQAELYNIDDDFKVAGKKVAYIDSTRLIEFDLSQTEVNGDMELMPLLDYFYSGLIVDKSTQLPLDNVSVTFFDENSQNNFETLLSDEGSFQTGILPYGYLDNVAFQIEFSLEGYAPVVLTRNDLLNKTSELKIRQELELIETGVDLAELLNLNPIYFDLNSSYIREDAAIELDKIVKILQENPTVKIELNSHTDSRASDHYNEWLSGRRAYRSMQYLIENGISKERITAKGYGETRLIHSDEIIAKQKTEVAKEKLHQENRRTEFIVVEK